MKEIMGHSALDLQHKFKSVTYHFNFATYKQMAIHQRLSLFSMTKQYTTYNPV
jgi:hypothetical protein